MSSLKNAFVAGMFAVSGAVSAQHADTTVVDTKQSLYIAIDDSIQTLWKDTVIIDDCVDPTVIKNTPIPTYQNPRKGSFIDLLNNGWLTEGVYTYKSDVYVEVKFKTEWKNTRIVVKMHQLVQDDPFWSYILKDRFVLDGYGHYLSRNPYPSDEARLFQSFLVSTPLSYVWPKLPVVPSL